jgi:DNA-binding response OmpR family regulator
MTQDPDVPTSGHGWPPPAGTHAGTRRRSARQGAADTERTSQDGEEATNNTDVLVVEDDTEVRDLVGAALAAGGLRLLSAADVDEAERLLSCHAPALLVTDLRLGSGSGAALATEARRRHPDLPVLIISGQPELGHGLAPPVEVLAKPFALPALVSAARRLLEAAASAGHSAACSPDTPDAPDTDDADDVEDADGVPARRVATAYEAWLRAVMAHLHDEHLQQLTAATLRLGLLRKLGGTDAKANRVISEVERTLVEASDRLRSEVLVLRPDWTDHATLGDSIDFLAGGLIAAGLCIEVAPEVRSAGIGIHGHRAVEALVGELDRCTSTGGRLVARIEENETVLTLDVEGAGGPPAGPAPQGVLGSEDRAVLAGGSLVRRLAEGRLTWTLRLPARLPARPAG